MKKKKNNSKKLLLIIIPVILIICVVAAIFIFKKDSSKDTYNIAVEIKNELAKNHSDVSMVDVKKDLQYKYSYLEGQHIFADGMDEFAITVSRYKSNIEATQKEKYISDINRAANEKLNGTFALNDDFRDKYNQFYSRYLIYVKGKYLFSINNKLANKEDLIPIIDKIMEKYDMSDEKKVDKEKVVNYWNKQLEEYKKELNKNFDEDIKYINEYITNYANELTDCEDNKCEDGKVFIEEYEKYEEFTESVNLLREKYEEIVED